MPKNKGKLFVITGPSGAGKDSVIEQVKKLGLKFGNIVTCTSRKPRGEEKDGVHYHFLSKKEFEEGIKDGRFVEHVEWCGNYYGNARKDIYKALKKNKIVISRIDPQGARSYKNIMPECKVIFVVPPSLEHLEKRLATRKTDSPDAIKARLEKAKKEMADLSEWDYVVVNEEGRLKETTEKVKKIILRQSSRGKEKLLIALAVLIILSATLTAFFAFDSGFKKQAEKTVHAATTPLVIQIKLRQSENILKYLPDTFYAAFLAKPSQESGLKKNIEALIPNLKNAEMPNFSETMFYGAISNNNWQAVMVAEINPPVQENWEKSKNAIITAWVNKYPSQRKLILPDGTSAIELVADKNSVKPEKLEYQGSEIYMLKTNDVNLAYALSGNYAIISNSVEAAEQAISAGRAIERKKMPEGIKTCLLNRSGGLAIFSVVSQSIGALKPFAESTLMRELFSTYLENAGIDCG